MHACKMRTPFVPMLPRVFWSNPFSSISDIMTGDHKHHIIGYTRETREDRYKESGGKEFVITANSCKRWLTLMMHLTIFLPALSEFFPPEGKNRDIDHLSPIFPILWRARKNPGSEVKLIQHKLKCNKTQRSSLCDSQENRIPDDERSSICFTDSMNRNHGLLD